MAVMAPKLVFTSLLLLGMVSFILISDQINLHRYISSNQIVDPLIRESLNVSKNMNISYASEISFRNSSNSNISYVIDVKVLENELLHESEYNSILQEFHLIRQKVLKFENKSFVSMINKRPINSKLIYADEVKDITSMTIGDQSCSHSYGSDLKVVIFVISRVDGFQRRAIIRETWAQKLQQTIDLKLYFAIGLTKDSDIQKRLDLENEKFNDILQWNFIDNYYNLTIKSIGILRWITLNCFKAKYIYKVDDDCIINYENLVNFCDNADEKTIYGHLWKKAFVSRNKNNKFFISKADYPQNSYPDYTGGPWLMSGSLVPSLYEKVITKSLPALPYEDVYITGVVASKLGIFRKQLPGLVYFEKSQFNKLNYCWFKQSIIFWQNLDDIMITNGWKNIIHSRDSSCITTTLKPIK